MSATVGSMNWLTTSWLKMVPANRMMPCWTWIRLSGPIQPAT